MHIPFCHSKCAYCDFYSMGNLRHVDRLVSAIQAEYEMRKDEMGSSSIETIYLGGGTPSIIEPALLEHIISSMPMANAREITLETNPEDVSAERVRAWSSIGFNRVSMGVQSMVDHELSTIGRRHDAQQARDAVAALRRNGITNYNLDLIYGLPGQDLDSWKYSVEEILSLNPAHVSAYSLTYEPRTKLTAWLKQGLVRQMDEDSVTNLYYHISSRLAEAGYEHYEISNWAKPGHRAMHNSNYWTGAPYLGLGPSAHSFDGTTRRINPANLTEYLRCIESGAPAFEIEPEDDSNRFNDMLITGLRTSEGINMAAINENRRRQLLHDANPFIHSGELVVEGDSLRFNEYSWLISDYVMERLIQLS